MKWTDAHLGDIRKCVKDPIQETWWHSAEEPWQFLAVCIELVAALDTPDPSTYHSNIPVQQDGSCNGLQHYAALGGDVQGAKQVNLSPSDSPQDVYAAVARLVEARISRDAEAGNPMAMALSGRITRKIIKQPVMTKVYGVTRYGARLQILARLKEFNTLPAAQLDAGATYLTGHVMATLKSLFGRAQAIQDWLTTTARDIGRSVPRAFAEEYGYKGDLETLPGYRVYYATPLTVSTGNKGTGKHNPHPHRSNKPDDDSAPKYRYPQTSITWTTPLGFQICQPYLDPETLVTKTCLQNSVSISATPTAYTPVNENKQTSAFPPNFIHSLDATHMFMTAIACHSHPRKTLLDAKRERTPTDDGTPMPVDGSEEKITFASVHDCFWTHAATVDAMNRVLREQFVELYSRPILQDLAKELREMYPDFKIPVIARRALRKENTLSEGEGEIGEELLVDQNKQTRSNDDAKREQVVKGWIPLVIKDPPGRGEFDLKEVLRSDYFFS